MPSPRLPPDFSTSQLRHFLLVADLGSYTAAAQQAHRSQSALSLAIEQLEGRLGQPLFERWARLMGEPDWLSDPRFASDRSRGEHGELIGERMCRWCATRATQEAVPTLGAAKIPSGPLLSAERALDHSQVQANGVAPGGVAVVQVGHRRAVAVEDPLHQGRVARSPRAQVDVVAGPHIRCGRSIVEIHCVDQRHAERSCPAGSRLVAPAASWVAPGGWPGTGVGGPFQ